MNIVNIKNDIILFKDETLKTLRKIENQLLEKIKLKDIETESKISEFKIQLEKFQEINKRMYESILEQQVNLENIKHLNDFKTKTDARLISVDAKLSNYFSDLINIRTRYDKIFSENLAVPGVIGTSCKYGTISDYIKANINITDQINRENDLMKKQVNELKVKNNLLEKNLNISIDDSISTCKLYADSRVNEIKIYFQEKFDELNRIVNSAKNSIEENILKNEKISNDTKIEIENNKSEIVNILEERNKDIEKLRKEIKNSKNAEIKNEINKLKNNFKELKEYIEKERNNSSNIIKNENVNKNTIIKKNSNKNEISIKLNLKTNNILKETKLKKNIGEKEHIKINANKQSNKTINNKDSFNVKYNLFKNTNDENNKEIEINKNIMKEKTGLKIGEKELKMRENENLIIFEKENKNTDINELNLLRNKNIKTGDNIILESSIKNKKERINNNDRMSRNKTFSEIKNDINILTLDNFNIHKKISTENYKSSNYPIHNTVTQNKKNNFSKDKENTISNLKIKPPRSDIFLNNINNNNKSEKNSNIAIKLIKNKKQKIINSDSLYLKQRYQTLKLYKIFYDKKIKEERDNKELNKIDLPKRVSPAFGRTAYSKFNKENDNIDLKKHNPYLNTIFNKNYIQDYINMTKSYTINGAIKNYNSRKICKSKREIDDDSKSNLSV
jgi:hypothetical protein